MTAIPARFAGNVGETIKNLPVPDKEELHEAVLRACADPWSWPQADKYDGMDESVRVITTRAAIVHYVIIPGPDPHLWVFAITV
ncbi:hypothetical protein [Streptomyces sp. RLB3-6]|uniref:hypothetical protein n=1 Tax=Streptomyces sp. RLB3-6 TaxID=2594457 RepID=UPI001163BAB1|nr:hypothetical protein [Streptomyces sp. RLB3-6]QDN84372.1 hypothetical protein FNV61_00140 [Streptomyces sp. RLB3-6]